ncbi:NAD(P)/FAD-dependent oxidoreductase [Mycetocola tolaasinivorans]|uniref:NAD(P)/FAD-dependent oxidoreductase n=1 Tax=Mycetocola tolaasinivorans TaxID=76635 RepID=A0A3L7ACK7_9MICO|nr:NAD(P)/FAD-dependent oxidoreductase [Mycetocola tolaasinivorans]
MIGAGPAGLAVARALKQHGRPYTQIERHTATGGVWDIDAPGTPMYESAHFISSRTLSGFGGFPMPDHYADYPPHRDILAYLRSFADAYGLTEAIEFGVSVARIEKLEDGSWLVEREGGETTRHDSVISCTGAQWFPNIPEIPGNFTGEVRHTLSYRSPHELEGKRVLVVGAGNSGCDIACDAARSADRAVISMRRGYWFIPKHIFGMPVDVFAEGGPHLPKRVEQAVFGRMLRLLVGKPERLGLQKPDHRLFETHPVLNSMLWHHLQHGDIEARPGIKTTAGKTVTFTDGRSEDFDLILLATGYRHLVPHGQEYFGDPQHPDLYLSSFSREHDGLYGVGYVETNSGAYQLFDLQAQLIANYLSARAHGNESASRFRQLILTERPDLSGGVKFDKSPRHRGYVDSHALTTHLRKLYQRMGWSPESTPPSAVPATAGKR